MSEVTRILSAIEQGDPHAAAALLPLVYEELRRLAAQKLGRTRGTFYFSMRESRMLPLLVSPRFLFGCP
jgi:hypothetical protein